VKYLSSSDIFLLFLLFVSRRRKLSVPRLQLSLYMFFSVQLLLYCNWYPNISPLVLIYFHYIKYSVVIEAFMEVLPPLHLIRFPISLSDWIKTVNSSGHRQTVTCIILVLPHIEEKTCLAENVGDTEIFYVVLFNILCWMQASVASVEKCLKFPHYDYMSTVSSSGVSNTRETKTYWRVQWRTTKMIMGLEHLS